MTDHARRAAEEIDDEWVNYLYVRDRIDGNAARIQLALDAATLQWRAKATQAEAQLKQADEAYKQLQAEYDALPKLR